MSTPLILSIALWLPCIANATEFIMHGASNHVITNPLLKEYLDENPLNERNPGIGLGLNGGLTTGFYYNSFRETTAYIGYTKPLKYGFSASILGATGYESLLGLKVMPMAVLNYDVIVYDRLGLKVSYIPGWGIHTFGFSFTIKAD